MERILRVHHIRHAKFEMDGNKSYTLHRLGT